MLICCCSLFVCKLLENASFTEFCMIFVACFIIVFLLYFQSLEILFSWQMIRCLRAYGYQPQEKYPPGEFPSLLCLRSLVALRYRWRIMKCFSSVQSCPSSLSFYLKMSCFIWHWPAVVLIYSVKKTKQNR